MDTRHQPALPARHVFALKPTSMATPRVTRAPHVSARYNRAAPTRSACRSLHRERNSRLRARVDRCSAAGLASWPHRHPSRRITNVYHSFPCSTHATQASTSSTTRPFRQLSINLSTTSPHVGETPTTEHCPRNAALQPRGHSGIASFGGTLNQQ